jgi:2-methylcitrate dehydratase
LAHAPSSADDDFAEDPRIDELRGKIYCEEDARYTKEYMEADKRSIGNGVLIEFNDGSKLDEVAMDYPVGHARRREESIPLIKAKLAKHLDGHFDQATQSKLVNLIEDTESFDKMPANEVGCFPPPPL